MPNIINQVSLVAGSGNTGTPRTVIEQGIWTGVILVPDGWKLSDSELQSAALAIAALKEDTHASWTSRIFPIGPFANLEAQDTDRTTEESALGFRRTIRRGKIGRRFEIWAGGTGYHQSVFSFDNTDLKAVFIDDKNNIIGTWVEDGSGNKEFYGLTLSDFSVSNYNPPTGTTGGKFFIDVQIANDSEMNTALAVVNLGVPVLTNVLGLNAVTIEDDDTATSATDTVRVQVYEGAENISSDYSTALAQATAWDVTDAADDTTAVVVASVSYNSTRESFILTLTTPPAAVNVGLKGTATLYGLATKVIGIEATETTEITVAP